MLSAGRGCRREPPLLTLGEIRSPKCKVFEEQPVNWGEEVAGAGVWGALWGRAAQGEGGHS